MRLKRRLGMHLALGVVTDDLVEVEGGRNGGCRRDVRYRRDVHRQIEMSDGDSCYEESEEVGIMPFSLERAGGEQVKGSSWRAGKDYFLTGSPSSP